jgi:adenylate cyclase class 2
MVQTITVMYEAEIKFVIQDPATISQFFDAKSPAQTESYLDTYLTQGKLVHGGSEREFRIRTIRRADGVRNVLTFKDKVVDAGTLSKREFEIEIGEADEATRLFQAMGFEPDIQLHKECVNWKFQHNTLQILASLVTVPELKGHFLELEAIVSDESQVSATIKDLRHLAESAGLSRQDETTTSYTGSVRLARSSTNS